MFSFKLEGETRGPKKRKLIISQFLSLLIKILQRFYLEKFVLRAHIVAKELKLMTISVFFLLKKIWCSTIKTVRVPHNYRCDGLPLEIWSFVSQASTCIFFKTIILRFHLPWKLTAASSLTEAPHCLNSNYLLLPILLQEKSPMRLFFLIWRYMYSFNMTTFLIKWP